MKDITIKLKDWDHHCADGCCYSWGQDIYLNGEQLDTQNAEDSQNALRVVLEHLGYKVKFENE